MISPRGIGLYLETGLRLEAIRFQKVDPVLDIAPLTEDLKAIHAAKIEEIGPDADVATQEVLQLGDEGIDGLELRMRFPRCRLVYLVGRFQERDEAIVAEDAVVDDEAALFNMRAVGPDAGRGGDVAPPGLDGDPVAGGIDCAGDDGLVP